MRVLNLSKVIVRRASDGKYLLLRSSKWEERPDRSQKPDFPGGMVERGEQSHEGAARELQEEAGLNVASRDLELVYAETFQSPTDGASITRSIYYIEVEGEPEVTISWEHEDFWWATLSELQSLEIRDPYPAIITYLSKVGVLN